MLTPKQSLYMYLSQKETSPLFCSAVYANMYPLGKIYENRNNDSNTKGIPIASKIIPQKE